MFFEHFLICSFCLRTHQIALSCSYSICNNGVPLICFLFFLIKIFQRHYLNFLKSLSEGVLYTHSALSHTAFTQRYLYLWFSLKLCDFFFLRTVVFSSLSECLPKHEYQTTEYCYCFSCIIC